VRDWEAAKADGAGPGLAIPFVDSKGQTFAVLEVERRRSGAAFADEDTRRLEELAHSLAGLLEAWFSMSCSCRKGRGLSGDATSCEGECAPSEGT
jgi:hypothetical protein